MNGAKPKAKKAKQTPMGLAVASPFSLLERINIMSKTFNSRMDKLMRFIDEYLSEHRRSNDDVHVACCHEAANEFDLWDEQNAFPIWLSRIVAGQMNDICSSDPKAFPNR
jgi:hypothetical protein